MRRTRRTLVVATAAFVGLIGVGGIAAASTSRHSERPTRDEVADRRIFLAALGALAFIPRHFVRRSW